ncbi:hypothetical protein Gorai_011825 [Gossypium raimondii]|uniref:Large ribosomal subunit protein uL6 N-terminal domain-containing protein n=1 Tax=Gossypium raimondii TaxID=29730 RepID=A0A7J8Q137_GOSRA|nr:hypothetical protein [Gossypium raimondii]
MLLSTFPNQKKHSSQSKGFKEEMAAKRNAPAKTQNPDLVRGVGKYSRSKMYHHKRSLWAIKAEHGGISPRYDPNPKAPLTTKAPKFYPADDISENVFLIVGFLGWALGATKVMLELDNIAVVHVIRTKLDHQHNSPVDKESIAALLDSVSCMSTGNGWKLDDDDIPIVELSV